MRLLNVRTLKLESFVNPSDVKYAILSHTWGEEEILYEDFQKPREIHYWYGLRPAWLGKIAAGKVTSSCTRALKDGFDYIWIDTCCIDKSSSAELSEAINSMFQWYGQAARCYAYLEDVDIARYDARGPDGGDGWKKTVLKGSRWFTRGWTLQELIAPPELELCDRCWKSIGTRDELAAVLEEITGISRIILHRPDRGSATHLLGCVSAACKMSWAAHRETTRPEDQAYCLMGLFDVNMPLLYGEGRKAFLRLQEEIIRTTPDQSILAHNQPEKREIGGILADEPSQFVSNIVRSRDISLQAWAYVAGELSLDVWLVDVGSYNMQAAILDCKVEGEHLSWPVIIISKIPGAQTKYIRSDEKLHKIVADDWGNVVLVGYRRRRPSRYARIPSSRGCMGYEPTDLDRDEPRIDMTAALRQRITLVSSPDSDFGGALQPDTPLEVRDVDLPPSLELRSKVSFDSSVGLGTSMGGPIKYWKHESTGVAGFWVQTRTEPFIRYNPNGTTTAWAPIIIPGRTFSETLKFFVLWKVRWTVEDPWRIESDRMGTAMKILRPDEFFDGEDEAGPDPWATVVERLSGGHEETAEFVRSCLESSDKSVEDQVEIGGRWSSAKFSQVSVLNRRSLRLDVKVGDRVVAPFAWEWNGTLKGHPRK